MIHALKIFPAHFDKVISGEKTFEVRKNDRNFLVGDYIALNEFTRESGYTGRSALYRITCVFRDSFPATLPEGYVILGIHPCDFKDRVENDLKPTVTESTEERGYF